MDEISSFLIGSHINDNEAMLMAIQLAQKGFGHVEPNPPVGCVILDQANKLIGFGNHEMYGGPHAEVQAVNSVSEKEQLRGAKVFVTLEPCGHTGKTPPCSDLLIEHNVGSVIYGVSDDNPAFSHSGLKRMVEAGIKVQKYVGPDDIQNQLSETVEIYFYSRKSTSNASFVSLKFASSLDGKIALKNNESQWITNEHSRKLTHSIRAKHTALLVGVNTLLADNPSLNVRTEASISKVKENKVIILDPSLRAIDFLKGSKLVQVRKPENIFICYDKGLASPPKGMDYSFVDVNIQKPVQREFDLSHLVEQMKVVGIESILVEGGAATLSMFIEQQIYNRIYAFLAPFVIGGQNGISWSQSVSLEKLNSKKLLSEVYSKSLGGDTLISGKNSYSSNL